jgi:hypothetical protein
VTVKLSEWWMMIARKTGKERDDYDRLQQWNAGWASGPEPNTAGVMGEIGVAVVLNVFPPLLVRGETSDKVDLWLPDGQGVQVKANSKRIKYVLSRDAKDRPYVFTFVNMDTGEVELRGWAEGRTFAEIGQWRTHKVNGEPLVNPCWFIQADKLTPMAAFPAAISKDLIPLEPEPMIENDTTGDDDRWENFTQRDLFN